MSRSRLCGSLQVGEQAAGQIYIFVIQDERVRRNVAKSEKVFVVATVMLQFMISGTSRLSASL